MVCAVLISCACWFYHFMSLNHIPAIPRCIVVHSVPSPHWLKHVFQHSQNCGLSDSGNLKDANLGCVNSNLAPPRICVLDDLQDNQIFGREKIEGFTLDRPWNIDALTCGRRMRNYAHSLMAHKNWRHQSSSKQNINQTSKPSLSTNHHLYLPLS